MYPDTDWLALHDTLGLRAFGVNAWRAQRPGAEVIERHTEEDYGHEELYVVVRGRARFEIAGETVEAPAGNAVFVRDPTAEGAPWQSRRGC